MIKELSHYKHEDVEIYVVIKKLNELIRDHNKRIGTDNV